MTIDLGNAKVKERQVALPGVKPGLLDSATSALPLSTHPVCRCSAIMIQKSANSPIYILFFEALPDRVHCHEDNGQVHKYSSD